MKKYFRISKISILSLFFILLSCEEIIDIDLNSSDARLVIEGVINDQPGPYSVKISKTTDYYNPDIVPGISGATVIISDNIANVDTLVETQSGVYQTSTIQGMVGRTYNLHVIYDGIRYQAESTIQQAINIDSLYYTESSIGIKKQKRYEIKCEFQDLADREDYARFKVYKNDEAESGYNLYNGRLSDGNKIEYERFRLQEIEPGDMVKIELLTIDKQVYEYYATLNDVIASDPKGPVSTEVPANPNSNIRGGALGYFGAFTIRSDSLLIQ